MTRRKEWFSKLVDCTNESIALDDNKVYEPKGVGCIPMKMVDEQVKVTTNVLYFSVLKQNLLSISKIIDNNLVVLFNKDQYLIKN
eukprot:Gb_18577 [translate_table: standard]